MLQTQLRRILQLARELPDRHACRHALAGMAFGALAIVCLHQFVSEYGMSRPVMTGGLLALGTIMALSGQLGVRLPGLRLRHPVSPLYLVIALTAWMTCLPAIAGVLQHPASMIPAGPIAAWIGSAVVGAAGALCVLGVPAQLCIRILDSLAEQSGWQTPHARLYVGPGLAAGMLLATFLVNSGLPLYAVVPIGAMVLWAVVYRAELRHEDRIVSSTSPASACGIDEPPAPESPTRLGATHNVITVAEAIAIGAALACAIRLIQQLMPSTLHLLVSVTAACAAGYPLGRCISSHVGAAMAAVRCGVTKHWSTDSRQVRQRPIPLSPRNARVSATSVSATAHSCRGYVCGWWYSWPCIRSS